MFALIRVSFSLILLFVCAEAIAQDACRGMLKERMQTCIDSRAAMKASAGRIAAAGATRNNVGVNEIGTTEVDMLGSQITNSQILVEACRASYLDCQQDCSQDQEAMKICREMGAQTAMMDGDITNLQSAMAKAQAVVQAAGDQNVEPDRQVADVNVMAELRSAGGRTTERIIRVPSAASSVSQHLIKLKEIEIDGTPFKFTGRTQ